MFVEHANIISSHFSKRPKMVRFANLATSTTGRENSIGNKWKKALTFAKSVAIMQKSLNESQALVLKDAARKGASNYMLTLRMGVKHADSVVRAFGAHPAAKKAAAEARELLSEGGRVVAEVATAEDLQKLELWQQGDSSLATEQKMLERHKLRFDRRVLEVLQAFWEASQRSIQSDDRGDACEVLSKEAHANMLKRVYRVMIRNYNEVEAEQSIAEDWVRDAKGKDWLTRKQFQDALFELADTWTRGICPYEYTAFLWRLHDQLTTTVRDANGHILAYAWKDERDCVHDALTYGDDEGENEGENAAGGGKGKREGEGEGEGGDVKGSADYRSRAKEQVGKSQEERSSITKIQAIQRAKKDRKEAADRKKAVAVIGKRSKTKVARMRSSAQEGQDRQACEEADVTGLHATPDKLAAELAQVAPAEDVEATKQRALVAFGLVDAGGQVVADEDEEAARMRALAFGLLDAHGHPLDRAGLLAEAAAVSAKVDELKQRMLAGELSPNELAELKALEAKQRKLAEVANPVSAARIVAPAGSPANAAAANWVAEEAAKKRARSLGLVDAGGHPLDRAGLLAETAAVSAKVDELKQRMLAGELSPNELAELKALEAKRRKLADATGAGEAALARVVAGGFRGAEEVRVGHLRRRHVRRRRTFDGITSDEPENPPGYAVGWDSGGGRPRRDALYAGSIWDPNSLRGRRAAAQRAAAADAVVHGTRGVDGGHGGSARVGGAPVAGSGRSGSKGVLHDEPGASSRVVDGSDSSFGAAGDPLTALLAKLSLSVAPRRARAPTELWPAQASCAVHLKPSCTGGTSAPLDQPLETRQRISFTVEAVPTAKFEEQPLQLPRIREALPMVPLPPPQLPTLPPVLPRTSRVREPQLADLSADVQTPRAPRASTKMDSIIRGSPRRGRTLRLADESHES